MEYWDRLQNINLNISDNSWQPVERSTLIPWDLESVPFQVLTNTTSTSNNWLNVILYDITQTSYGSYHPDKKRWIALNLLSTGITYELYQCNLQTILPIQPTAGEPKIWRFSKTNDSVRIECNGTILLTYNFNTSTNCQDFWKGDIVDKIAFWGADKASKFYRRK